MNHFHLAGIVLVRFSGTRRRALLMTFGILLTVGSFVGMGCQTQAGMTICGTIAGIGCPKGLYCVFDEGTCNVADGAGVCMITPAACTEQFSPVCGCDGVTYGNDCKAAKAGVSVDSRNECEAMVCGTIAGIACPAGMYCAFGEGRCNVADDAGVCSTTPEVCIELFAPVCGCDGMTYGNTCMAASAGVSLSSQGSCSAP